MKSLKVVIFSLIALACMVLVFLVDWLFIIPAVVLAYLSQRELMKKKDISKAKNTK